jgi:hypothetical protein
MDSPSAQFLLISHAVFEKPVSTFSQHALASGASLAVTSAYAPAWRIMPQ